METKTIGLASDHAGFALKQFVKKYLEEKHFTEGSMAPKVRAAIQYVEKSGKTCIITEAGRLQDPNCGTRIIAG